MTPTTARVSSGGEDMYEDEGFIVHYFSRNKVERLALGYQLLDIEEFEESKLAETALPRHTEKARETTGQKGAPYDPITEENAWRKGRVFVHVGKTAGTCGAGVKRSVQRNLEIRHQSMQSSDNQYCMPPSDGSSREETICRLYTEFFVCAHRYGLFAENRRRPASCTSFWAAVRIRHKPESLPRSTFRSRISNVECHKKANGIG